MRGCRRRRRVVRGCLGLGLAALLWLLVAGAGGVAWAVSYFLPWTVGDTYECTQGNRGLYSHWGNSAYGWDFGLPAGAVVRASAPGTVTGCRNGVVGYVSGSWVNYVLIEHADGTFTRYAHLITGSVAVSVGERVGQGERIGLCGNTGASDGAHLHFQREGVDKMFVPLSFADAGVPVEEGRYTSGNVQASTSQLCLAGPFVVAPGPYVGGRQLPVTFTVRNAGATGTTHAANVRLAEYNGLLEGLVGFGRTRDGAIPTDKPTSSWTARAPVRRASRIGDIGSVSGVKRSLPWQKTSKMAKTLPFVASSAGRLLAVLSAASKRHLHDSATRSTLATGELSFRLTRFSAR